MKQQIEDAIGPDAKRRHPLRPAKPSEGITDLLEAIVTLRLHSPRRKPAIAIAPLKAMLVVDACVRCLSRRRRAPSASLMAWKKGTEAHAMGA